MQLTEKEANNKTCPFMTYCTNPDQASYNYFSITANQLCEGSSCMARVWHDMPVRKAIKAPCTVPENWVYCPEGDDPECWVEPELEWLSRRTGYCRRLYVQSSNL